MNSDNVMQNVMQSVQKGFRVSLGATAALVESLQSEQRREENLAKLRSNPNLLVEEWELKGVTTEQEARTFVDTLWSQSTTRPAEPPVSSPPTTPSTPGYATGVTTFPSTISTTTSTGIPTTPPDLQQDLRELTAQITALRAELEQLRQGDN